MGLLDTLGNLTPEQTQGLLGFSASMLQAGGPSLKPTSFGQAFGNSILGFQNAYDAAIDKKQERDMLNERMQMLKLQEQRAQQQFEIRRDAYGQLMGKGTEAQPQPSVANIQLGSVPMQSRPGQPLISNGSPVGGSAPSLNALRAAAIADVPGAKELFEIYKYENEPQKLESGSTYRDRLTGVERYMPKLDNGITVGPDGVAAVMPGYDKSNAQIKGAETAAQEESKAKYDLVNPSSYPSIGGVPVNGSISRLNLLNQLKGPAAPASTPDTYQPVAKPAAPWDRVVSPAERDQVRARTYDASRKALDDLRAEVSKGREVMTDLNRFGALNQNTGTGGLVDRIGFLPTVDSDKREMDAIQARLAPSARPAGSGSSSDKDMALFLSALPGTDKPGDVNKAIRVQFEKKLKDKESELRFKEQYLIDNGHLDGADKAYEQSRETAGFDPSKLTPEQRAYMQRENPKAYADGIEAFNNRPSRQNPSLQPSTAQANQKVATLADIVATARASGKTTAQVTADLKAQGYKIGGK
ncbi:hypothetical protein GTP23_12820 [Pseudoduganella sp. FT93W]|uniref:Uncharacterized protein n=1 Tax=Duganella fentianensis TaxID=2692177 RepID=A0A845I2K1_9BURK|nr:hypothetical protein [Duganella fentianensis]MYN45931.1 hypothetical protein [Duganella fentianensis]